MSKTSSREELARDWSRAVREAMCDVQDRGEHGTVLRSSRYPRWWDRNLVRVEDDLEWAAAELVALADRALADLDHRLIAFEDRRVGERYRAELEQAGYRTTRLVWMHHEEPGRFSAPAGVAEVAWDQVAHLRTAWHQEDFPGTDCEEFHAGLRESALEQGARVLASFAGSRPVGFSELDPLERQVEVGAVFVLPAHRGRGHGTALTKAAIAGAGTYDHVWISADADDRPQHLYARLGFRPVLWTVEFLRPA